MKTGKGVHKTGLDYLQAKSMMACQKRTIVQIVCSVGRQRQNPDITPKNGSDMQNRNKPRDTTGSTMEK
jgi:hypothetical protein